MPPDPYERLAFSAGDTIMSQGEIGTFALLIDQGEVEILVRDRQGERQVAVLSAGDIVGEMALVDGEPRSASVRALTDGNGTIIPWYVFMTEIDSAPPIVRKVIQSLTRKLRLADLGRA